jgi:putative membrane protein
MSSVKTMTVALATMLMTSAGALSAQDSASRDTAPWYRRGTQTFPSRTGADTNTAALASDTAFIRQAIRGNALEVQLGRLAQGRADASAVEEFARRMVTDHGSMGQQWATVARNNGVSVDTDLSDAEESTVDRLEGFSGNAFDRAYMSYMVQHHEQQLTALQQAATTARSADVRRLATSGVTGVRQHLTLARQVGSSVGVGPVATTPSDTAFRSNTGVGDDRARNERDRDRNDRAELPGEDRTFVMSVLSDHLMHIRLAERAQREARNGATRRLAQQMKQDFTRWQERWSALASRRDLEPATHLGRMHQQVVERLERAGGQDVDRTYAAIVAEQLGSLVPYLRQEGQAVRSPGVRRLAEEELTVIRDHLQRARQLQGQAGSRAERSERN